MILYLFWPKVITGSGSYYDPVNSSSVGPESLLRVSVPARLIRKMEKDSPNALIIVVSSSMQDESGEQLYTLK